MNVHAEIIREQARYHYTEGSPTRLKIESCADEIETLERENAALKALIKRAQLGIINHHSHNVMKSEHAVCPYCTGNEGDTLLNDLANAVRDSK